MPGETSPPRDFCRWPLAVLAACVTLGLSLLAQRGIPRVGFDSHYYLEYAKSFRRALPRTFGSEWPYGYPILGAALSRLGLTAAAGLRGVLLLSLAGIYALLWPMLVSAAGRRGRAAALLLGFAAIPILPLELGTLRSEIAFAGFYLAAVASMAGWPARRAMTLAAIAALLSFTIRYAGVFTLGTLALWTIWSWPRLPQRDRAFAAAAVTAAGAASLAMLWRNWWVSGVLAGPARGGGRGLVHFAASAADLGWGTLVTVSSVGVRTRFVGSALYRPVGWLLLGAVFALALWRWRRPVSRWSQPLALALAVYLAGMIPLQCYDGFDALFNGRHLLPVLPLGFALLVESVRNFPWRAAIVLAVACAGSGAAVCWRGVSPGIAYDFTPVVQELKARLTPSDTIGVNQAAMPLSAWYDFPVRRIDDVDRLAAIARSPFIVVAGEAADRAASRYAWPDPTRRLVRDLEQSDGYREVRRWPGCLLLERRAPRP